MKTETTSKCLTTSEILAVTPVWIRPKQPTRLTKELNKTTERVKRLRWLKISTARKVSIINSDILQAGLYGCETGRMSVDVMAKFKTAIVDAIGTKSQHRAQEIIFEIHDRGKEIDPEIQALVRKVSLLRRITDKFPSITER